MADFATVLRDELECIKRRRYALVKETSREPDARGNGSRRVGEEHLCAAKVAATVVPDTSGKRSDIVRESADHVESAEMAARLHALDMHVAGLAISGGGIRSATFALGVLQALAHFKLLRRFDYLSTVSGGGYIGSWLAAWIQRDQSIANVESQLAPSRINQSEAHRRLLPQSMVVDEEPETIHHLRAYSDYLTPRLGVLTPDTWTILAIYFRNILINLLMLLPATDGALARRATLGRALICVGRRRVTPRSSPASPTWPWSGSSWRLACSSERSGTMPSRWRRCGNGPT